MASIFKSNALQIAVAISFIVFFFIFNRWYNGPTEQLTDVEIDAYFEKMEQSQDKLLLPDGNGNINLKGWLNEMREFAKSDDGKPFYMANIMRLREQPIYPEGYEFKGSVAEADEEYAKKLIPILAAMGAHPAYVSNAMPNAITYGATSEANHWDQIALIRYKSRRDFFDMLTNDEYIQASVLKGASMGTVVLTPTQPFGLPDLINPLPNLTFLVFFALSLAYVILFWRLEVAKNRS